MKSRSFFHHLVMLLFAYVAAYGLMLLNTGIYVDDWAYYQEDSSLIFTAWKESGRPLFGYILAFLFSLPRAVTVFRIGTFLAYLLSAIFLDRILRNIEEIESDDRLWIVFFFTLFPVNFERIILVSFPYALSYCAFFAAFWILSRYLKNTTLWGLRLLALLLFYFSFFTASLLMFYGIVLGYLIYAERGCIKSIADIFKRGIRYLDFLAIPIVFWIMRGLFFQPYGPYAGGGYNQVRLEYIIGMLREFHHIAYNSFLYPMLYAFDVVIRSSKMSIILGLLGVILLAVLLVRKYGSGLQRSVQQRRMKIDILMMLLGAILFILAIFPYCAVNKRPDLFDWQDRHHLLVPLGAAFLLVYGLKIVIRRKLRIAVNIFLVALFVFASFLAYLNYQKDWFKQLSFVEQIKRSDIFDKHTTFLFSDTTGHLNGMQREYFYYYEFTRMMEKVFGDQTRFGMTSKKFCTRFADDFNTFFEFSEDVSPIPQLHMGNYQPQLPEYEVVMKEGKYQLTRNNTLRLLYWQLFARQKFESAVSEVVFLEYRQLDTSRLQDTCERYTRL